MEMLKLTEDMIVEVWIVEYADYQLFIHSVVFIVLLLCFN